MKQKYYVKKRSAWDRKSAIFEGHWSAFLYVCMLLSALYLGSCRTSLQTRHNALETATQSTTEEFYGFEKKSSQDTLYRNSKWNIRIMDTISWIGINTDPGKGGCGSENLSVNYSKGELPGVYSLNTSPQGIQWTKIRQAAITLEAVQEESRESLSEKREETGTQRLDTSRYASSSFQNSEPVRSRKGKNPLLSLWIPFLVISALALRLVKGNLFF